MMMASEDCVGNGNEIPIKTNLKDANDGNCFSNKENGLENENKSDEGDALGNLRFMNQNMVAKMPVERTATHYKMNHKKRGIALIFNHEFFLVSGLKRRSGTSVDCQTLACCLDKLGFEVHVFQDLDYNEICEHVQQFARHDHSESDCFFMAVLTHGEMGILYARNAQYKPDILWSSFTADNCLTLAGKPKLFFIQACQGDKLDGGVTLSRTETDGGSDSNSYRIPSQADFLIAYSTVPGYFSWRNTTKGSWFIQALCEELQENAYNYDILTLLTFVCQRVAFDYESNVPDSPTMHRQKQIPCISFMLTRLLKFTKPGSETVRKIVEQQKTESKNILSGIFSRGKNNLYQVN